MFFSLPGSLLNWSFIQSAAEFATGANFTCLTVRRKQATHEERGKKNLILCKNATSTFLSEQPAGLERLCKLEVTLVSMEMCTLTTWWFFEASQF